MSCASSLRPSEKKDRASNGRIDRQSLESRSEPESARQHATYHSAPGRRITNVCAMFLHARWATLQSTCLKEPKATLALARGDVRERPACIQYVLPLA
eukprot:8510438-Pyramimonas_sp.AAC.1